MHYDLTIVGGGLVGAGLAVALRDSGLNIALMDANPPRDTDPRLFALNHSACQLLRNLNLWPDLAPHATPIHQVHVSQAGQFGAVRLSREDANLPELGFVIPACYLEKTLNLALSSLKNLTLYRPVTLEKLIQTDDEITLTLSNQDTFTSKIVIGADGAASTVREQLNLPSKEFDYQQSAIVTRTTLHRPHQHIAYERFCEHGAIAMLPLTEFECATIWTSDNKNIAHLMSLSDQAYVERLQTAFGYRLGRFEKIAQRHSFPLKMVIAEQSIDQSVMLLGNAAHALHPIAAQGFNLALYEVAVLAQAIMKKTMADELFTAKDLALVHKKIQDQQQIGISMSHRLTQIFSNPVLKCVLPIGMTGLDLFPGFKHTLINKMMGRSGKTPELLL